MIDSVRFTSFLEPLEIQTDASLGWKKRINRSRRSWYKIIFTNHDEQTDMYFVHLFDPTYRNPGLLKFYIKSLPRLIHGTNSLYFSPTDLGAFETILADAYDRLGIMTPVDFSELWIEKVDMPLNILFLSKQDSKDVLGALIDMPSLSGSFPVLRYPDAVYWRYMHYKGRKSPTRSSGLLCYNKTPEALRHGLDPSMGVLRFEIRLPNSASVVRWLGRPGIKKPTRWFQRHPSLQDFFDSPEKVHNTFNHYLSVAGISSDTSLVSIDEAARPFAEPYIWAYGWPYAMLKVTDFDRIGRERIGDDLVLEKVRRSALRRDKMLIEEVGMKVRQAMYFRDHVLRDSYGIMPAFLDHDHDGVFDLHSMLMDEFGRYWAGTSPFVAETAWGSI